MPLIQRKSTWAMKRDGEMATVSNDPVEGFYEERVTEIVNGVKVREWWLPIKLWYGPPSDPVTGEELDRSWRWQALIDGHETEWYEVWPNGRPISQGQYEMMLASEYAGEIVTRVDFAAIKRKS
jgi:hypothetical protein